MYRGGGGGGGGEGGSWRLGLEGGSVLIYLYWCSSLLFFGMTCYYHSLEEYIKSKNNDVPDKHSFLDILNDCINFICNGLCLAF